MVISDFYETKKNQITKLQAAHLMDRFFSFLIDCIVISPFVMFFLSLLFNDGYLFLKGHRQAPEQNSLFVISSLSYVMCFSFIQSLFIVFYKATPGQYFLKVQMQFNENQAGLFLRAFLRQVFFWMSLCFLGLPFLSVMTNKARRTFYDRITDINIVTKKIEKDFFTFEKEFKYWQSLMSTIVVFALFLVSSFIWSCYTKIVNRNLSFTKLEESHFFCDDLNGVSASNRLTTAVGLNLVGQFSDECLNSEADFVLWKEKKSDISLAYYAKSLTAKQYDIEKKYLEKACDVDSVSMGCKLSIATMKNSWNELYATIENDNLLNSILKYEIALQYKNINEIEINFTSLEKFNTLKLVKRYQINEILQNQNNESARSPASLNTEDGGQQKLLLELIEGL